MLYWCLLLCCLLSARAQQVILITGGDNSPATQTAEIYDPASGTQCSLTSEFPDKRFAHTQDGSLTCGGSQAADSCLVWSSGSWTKSHSLTRARRSHISFPTSQGTFLLGGYTNPQTSDLLKEDGTVVPGFDLKYRTETACGIVDPIEEMLFVTGGFEMNKVSMYTAEGWNLDLPDLVEGRKKHACTSFLSGENRVLMVTGGDVFFGMYRDTTELFDTSVGSWRVVAGLLPAPMYGLSAATVDNRVLAFGGYDGDYLDTVLELDFGSEEWVETDKMTIPRSTHAVTVVDFSDYSDFCN